MANEWDWTRTTNYAIRKAPQVAAALREIKGEMSHLYALLQMVDSEDEETKKIWKVVLEELDKHGK
jgi:hypothetical protein